MKRICILLIAIISVVAFCPQKIAADGGKPKIQFKETLWDFGTIKKDQPASHSFNFTNVGDGNLIILKATAECGCTRPEFSEKPVAPGKNGSIKVSYNPIGRPGSFEKTITVRTNAGSKPIRLKIRGVVMP